MRKLVVRCAACISLALLLSPMASGQHEEHAAAIVAEIDGNKEPHRIPDSEAYRHFFGLLSMKPDGQPNAEEERRRSYLSFYFRPGCGVAKNDDRTLTNTQVDELLAMSDTLEQKIRVLDSRITALRPVAKTNNSATTTELADLIREKEDTIMQAVYSIPLNLGSDGAGKVGRHVTEHVKRNIRMITVRVPSN